MRDLTALLTVGSLVARCNLSPSRIAPHKAWSGSTAPPLAGVCATVLDGCEPSPA